MGTRTLDTRQKVANHIFGKATYTQPTIYISLWKGDPAGAGVEVSAVDYSRKVTAASDWDTADANAIIDNVNNIEFPEATNEWAPEGDKITHFALHDAISAGNMIGSDDVPTPKAIAVGDTVRFKAGEITYQET